MNPEIWHKTLVFQNISHGYFAMNMKYNEWQHNVCVDSKKNIYPQTLSSEASWRPNCRPTLLKFSPSSSPVLVFTCQKEIGGFQSKYFLYCLLCWGHRQTLLSRTVPNVHYQLPLKDCLTVVVVGEHLRNFKLVHHKFSCHVKMYSLFQIMIPFHFLFI